ncbi:RraA family protein [Pelagimonas varians]|uniref:Putative 4-hydroxy-4-methyl-2-oxoglutarate aldolase n=1 Tax=Pelagimonas varians TaxID=696760 RepID=A0A238KUA1_9RHOB|nr:RraA family protein [Pelagimonas varians]PYG28302.1 regulator of RNase E activity RraA [Pelagimonas varians]SMX46423.1 4-hydroxy-4-methyl-2-oxoglutarate aldolase [Pelagimonas varians]
MLTEPPALTLVDGAPRPSQIQIDAFDGVPTSFVCDALGGFAAMAPQVAPVGFGRDLECRAHGPALVAANSPGDIMGTFGAIHMAQPGDFIVAQAQGHQGCAAAGDLVLGQMRNAGVVGFATDGPMRDYDGIVAAGLPAWCTGLTPNSPFSKGPGQTGGAALVGGCLVTTGDMIVADRDGVVVIPFAKIDSVIAQLPEIKSQEAERDANVRGGFKTPLDLEGMLGDGRARRQVFTS